MADAIDPAEAEQARALLADWWNAWNGESEPRMVADSFVEWQVGRWEEFLLYAPAGGHANEQYLVGHGVVKPFSFATDTIDSALEAARAERDGLIVPDCGAAERVVDRLLAVRWDGIEAYDYPRSRSALAYEFLRRSAKWAKALGAEGKWPFFDVAAELDPEVRADPALVDRLVAGLGDYIAFPPMRTMTEGAVHWAALGDLPRRRFPELGDPFEALLLLFEHGGGFTTGNGFMELGSGSFPMRTLAARIDLEPVQVDEATLDALESGSSAV